jgi:hypothetical protein
VCEHVVRIKRDRLFQPRLRARGIAARVEQQAVDAIELRQLFRPILCPDGGVHARRSFVRLDHLNGARGVGSSLRHEVHLALLQLRVTGIRQRDHRADRIGHVVQTRVGQLEGVGQATGFDVSFEQVLIDQPGFARLVEDGAELFGERDLLRGVSQFTDLGRSQLCYGQAQSALRILLQKFARGGEARGGVRGGFDLARFG